MESYRMNNIEKTHKLFSSNDLIQLEEPCVSVTLYTLKHRELAWFLFLLM